MTTRSAFGGWDPAVIEPGTFGLSRSRSLFGLAVRIGQVLVGDHSRYSHAFLVLDGGEIAEATPHGVEINPASKYLSRSDVVWARAPRLTTEQRAQVLADARTMRGVRYAWSVYLLLALTRLGLPSRWLAARVEKRGEVICSMFVDLVYQRAGVHLFKDGRPHYYVTPGDLANWLIEEAPYHRNPGGVSAL